MVCLGSDYGYVLEESLMLRDSLRQLSSSILQLHKALLDQERARFETEKGVVGNPFKVLELVMHDPFFAWLRPLSAFVVKIDEAIDDDTVEPSAGAILREGEALLGGAGELASRLSSIMQTDVDVAVLYGAVRHNLRQIAPVN